MRKSIFMMAAASLLVAATATAQTEIAIGVKGGLNIPKITAGGKKTPLSEGYSSRLAGAAGVFTELKFTKTFSLTIGLEYSGQGGKNDNTVFPSDKILPKMMADLGGDKTTEAFQNMIIQLGGPTSPPAQQVAAYGQYLKTNISTLAANAPKYLYTKDIESTTKFNYIMLPVQARFGWDLGQSPWRLYVQAGAFASYLVSAERVMTGQSAFYVNQTGTSLGTMISTAMTGMYVPGGVTNPASIAALDGFIAGVKNNTDTPRDFGTQGITQDLYRWNVGVIGAAGINYNIHTHHNIFFEAGGNYGFVKLQKNAENGQNRIGAGTISLGYSYML